MTGHSPAREYTFFYGKGNENQLGRPRPRWVHNSRIDLGEVGWGDVNWISLAQDRNCLIALVNSVSINCWEILLSGL
jgi:hypothetical protein